MKMLDVIKEYAFKQWEDIDNENNIGFEFEGMFIVNPFMDPTGRFELTIDEADKLYGKLNMDDYLLQMEDRYL